MVDLVGIETDDLFHAMVTEKQPEVCFQMVSNCYIGRKPVLFGAISGQFPA
jgi:hypothetical protein